MGRGIPMLEASLAATVAVREQLMPEQAAGRARALPAAYAEDLTTAETRERAIVLLHHEDSATATARALAHEKSVTPPTLTTSTTCIGTARACCFASLIRPEDRSGSVSPPCTLGTVWSGGFGHGPNTKQIKGSSGD
ncbi:hypothetical protein [Streptomyces sp. NPDC001933]|uniref:hypothetical protein n=1 Tax=Streptomyces sp. NPDC001933 TaxID=3364626 RepID=UPI0036C2DAAC